MAMGSNGVNENITPEIVGGTNNTQTAGNTLEDLLKRIQGNTITPATDQSESIQKMYADALAANKAQLESAYQQNLSGIDAQESGLGQNYYEARRQTQAQADRQRQADAEYMNARGLNTGAEGQAELARQNQLAGNLNSLRQSETEKRAEIARQRTLLGQQYQQAIQQAQAENDLQKAQALYDEAVRIDTSIRQAEQADADRALQIFNILNNNAMNYASTAAANGDLSVYRNVLGSLGLDSLLGVYGQQMSGLGFGGIGGYSGGSGSYSGGGGSYSKASTAPTVDGSETLGSTAWYLKLDTLAQQAGQDVSSYINQHYKELGIPYSQLSSYAKNANETIKQYSHNTYKIGSEAGYQLAAGLNPGQSVTASDGSVWTKLSDGSISVSKGGMKMIVEVTYNPTTGSYGGSSSPSGGGSYSQTTPTAPATSGTYYIGSEKGAAFAQMLNPGQSLTATDGSTWTKNADGTITVLKNGQTMRGEVTYKG